MKIAFFNDCYLDLTGGIIGSTGSLKAELERLGHTVYIFSTGYPKSKQKRAELARKHIYQVPSCKLFFYGLTPISRRPKIIERWVLKHFPEIKDFDVFHIHYEAGCSIAGIRLGKKLGIPVIQTMHGREDAGETNLIPYGLRTFVAWNLNWFHSWYLPHRTKVKKDNYLADTRARRCMWELMVNHANAADVVITPSEHFRKKLKHYGVNKPIVAVPNAIDGAIAPEQCIARTLRPGEPLRIIWHSRVSAEKRMMVFLHALALVKGNYRLSVYGGGGDYFRAKRFAKRHHLNAVFYNTTPFKKVYKELLKSHLDVLISYNFDTFGMTLVEAESAGVPSLICDPDLKEVVPEGSFVMSKGADAESIAKALDDLISHPERINEMSKILLKHRHEVYQSERIKETIRIYKEAKKCKNI